MAPCCNVHVSFILAQDYPSQSKHMVLTLHEVAKDINPPVRILQPAHMPLAQVAVTQH